MAQSLQLPGYAITIEPDADFFEKLRALPVLALYNCGGFLRCAANRLKAMGRQIRAAIRNDQCLGKASEG